MVVMVSCRDGVIAGWSDQIVVTVVMMMEVTVMRCMGDDLLVY